MMRFRRRKNTKERGASGEKDARQRDEGLQRKEENTEEKREAARTNAKRAKDPIFFI